MSSELALHAYIFLGNALHLLVNAAPAETTQALSTTHADLLALHAAVEPLTPANILDGLSHLEPTQRDLLTRCTRWCLDHPAPDFQTRFGVHPHEAKQVLAHLETMDPATGSSKPNAHLT